MSTDPGIWGWTGDIGRAGFTLTLSLGRTPDDVLRQYGADPGRAEELTRDQSWVRYPPGHATARLRTGTLGRWGFCFEEAGAEGIKPATLSRLSAETETLAFCSTGATGNFLYLKDAYGVEAFEPGRPQSLRGQEPHVFWSDTQRILARSSGSTPMPPVHALLQAIAKHVRGLLDRATLEGPLLTAALSDTGYGTGQARAS